MNYEKINLNNETPGSVLKRELIGERTLDLFESLNNPNRSRAQRWGDFRGMLFSGALDYFVRNIGAFILRSLMTLYTFDWNKTDKEIEQQMKANEAAIYSAAGTLAANGLVYMTGIGMLNSAARRYPVVTGKAALMAAEEGGEEIRSAIMGFLTATRSTVASNVILSTYLSYRQMTQGAVTEKKEPWIAADQIEKLVESNKDQNARAFWESFKDQTEDAVLDLGYIINHGFIDAYENAKRQRELINGKTRTVVLQPDKNDESSKVWLHGSTNQLMPVITQTIANAELIQAKDVGQIVSSEPDTAVKATRNKRQLEFYYYSTENGATTTPDGKRATKAVIKISDCDDTTTWSALKTAARPYTRGNYQVTGKLDNGHAIVVWASTEQEGKEVIQSMAPLQKGTIVGYTASEVDPNNPLFKKNLERMYCKYAKLRILRPTSDPAKVSVRDRLSGEAYRVINVKIPLNVSTEPNNLPSLITGEF